MPGRALTYKFLNTFIDDLFAFTIKMPTLHRLATLRDDVIFFVWVYQSYKYKVDYTRVNEFGQGGEEEEEAADNDKGKKTEKTDGASKKQTSKPEGQATGSASSKPAARKRK